MRGLATLSTALTRHTHSLDIVARLQVTQHVPDTDGSGRRMLSQHILDLASLCDSFERSSSDRLFAEEGDRGESFEESEFGVSAGFRLSTELRWDTEDRQAVKKLSILAG